MARKFIQFCTLTQAGDLRIFKRIDKHVRYTEDIMAASNAKEPGKGKGCRRAQEDEPSLQYVAKMQELGPRDRESLLSFRKRLAAIREGRRFCIDTWIDCRGNQEACAKALGVARNSLAHELKMVGLNKALLDSLLQDLNKGS